VIEFVMPRLNFEQAIPESRDVGGLSSKALLMLAVGMTLLWALLILIAPQTPG
jgi:hypothetical protein